MMTAAVHVAMATTARPVRHVAMVRQAANDPLVVLAPIVRIVPHGPNVQRAQTARPVQNVRLAQSAQSKSV